MQRTAETLGLSDLLKRKPAQLSGGQRQRVAMGRAIVRDPAAFLMDEPLSNLDAKLRVQMRTEIQRLQHELGTTTMYVTHDQVEAMTMGDRVAVMRDGRLVQLDTPQVLYDRPADLFVAGFIGSPAMNFVRAHLEASNGTLLASFGSNTLELPERALPPALARDRSRDVIIGLRPGASRPRGERLEREGGPARTGHAGRAGGSAGDRPPRRRDAPAHRAGRLTSARASTPAGSARAARR